MNKDDGANRRGLRAELARRLLEVETGSRLPTVREWSHALQRSVGSVQSELARLQDDGAVSVDRRGKLGMFLQARSLGKLWAAAEGEPLVAAMPLPTTRRLEGLATGIKYSLNSHAIDTYFIFVRGSRRRMEALRRGRCHIAVMSVLAARELCGPDEEIALELERGSFVAGHAVFTVPGRRRRRRRVIIDPDSIDQQRLCEAEFADEDIDVASAPYMQFAQLLESGQADATVWSIDEMADRRPEGILVSELSPKAQALAQDTDTRCALVIRAGDVVARVALVEALKADTLTSFQAAVIAGRTVPEY